MPIRIKFTHCYGLGFYELAARSKKSFPESPQKLSRWVVTKPEGVAWHRLPEAQAASWETAAQKLTGLSPEKLAEVGVEIYDVESRRVLLFPDYRNIPVVSA